MDLYLKSTEFITARDPVIHAYCREACRNCTTEMEMALALYYKVRDGVRYNPYSLTRERAAMQADQTLVRGYGYCVTKAVLLAACYRNRGIPARLGFADVKNHLATGRLIEMMQTNLFIWHGFTEVYLEGRWVKATPAFNLGLCEAFGVKPLEFNGREDSIFHPYDTQGRQHMEYVAEHGSFADLPFGQMMSAYAREYPHYFKVQEAEDRERGHAHFKAEARAENPERSER